MRRVGHAWAAAVAVVALLAPGAPAFAAPSVPSAPAALSPTAAPPAVEPDLAELAPAVAAASSAEPHRIAESHIAESAARRPSAVPSALPAATRSADAVAASGELELSVSAEPMPVAIGGIVTVTMTVTNLALPADLETDRLAVTLDWRASSFRPVAESGSSLWHLIGTGDGYRNWPETTGDRCLIEGASVPGATGQCVVRLRDTGVRPFGTTSAERGEFRATAVGWVDVSTEAFEFTPLEDDQIVSSAVGVAAESAYQLSVENFDYLGLAAVGDDEPVLGRFTVTSSEVAVRGIDDAELVVRLSWPEGMVLDGSPPPGCVALGAAALDCTIDDANLLPGLPDPPVEYDDLYQRVLRGWDLYFTTPAFQVERERLDTFDIEFVSGWTYTEPIIALASWANRAHGASGVGRATSSRTVPVGLETSVLPAASPTPPGGITMNPAWANSDSTPFAILDRVFTTTTEADAEFLSSGGDEVSVVVTVMHHPEVTTVLTASEVAVRLDWPAFVVPLGAPEGCTSYLDHVCTIEGLDEPGATVEITMEFGVPAGPPIAGLFETTAESVIVVEPNSDGDIEHGFPDRWIQSSIDRLVLDDALVSLDVLLSDDYVWEDGPMLSALVTPTRASREVEQDSSSYEFWDQIIVEIAITWPDYLTLMSTPSGCALQAQGLVCEVTMEEPGTGPTIPLAFSVGPGVTDGLVTAEGAHLQNYFPGFSDAPPYTEDLPVEWVIPDDEPLAGIEPFIPLDVEVDRDLVWAGGGEVAATVTATRPVFPGAKRDPFDELVVSVRVTWPAFLHPTAPPVGCESWNGEICVIVLPKPGAVVTVGLAFSVGGAPPGSVLTGPVRAEAVSLTDRNSDGELDLPLEWVAPDEEPVTRFRATVGLDLTLDHDPGYTGGKQLVVTTTVTRENPGATLDGLVIGLDFEWAGYLTRTTQTGCATFAGTTCTVTGLDEPGASAVVTLTFAMPPPTLPPTPIQAPRTDDLAVDGVSLSFDAPPAKPLPQPPEPEPDPDPDPDPPGWPPDGCYINSDGVCVCTNQSQVCPPEPTPTPEPTPEPEPAPTPVDGTLPPSWIGQDREPFTVLQPNLLFSQSVATPGDGIEAFGAFLPPNARITLRWEGTSPTVGTQWPNPANPTEGRWSLVVLRWQGVGEQQLVMHSEDGLFADVPTSNSLLVVPRSAMGPDLVGRGG
ncbi:hypothetical protein [Agromyces sp. NPDC058110]|uniref:hypothetical protein n=1 Tax=Agromyces sp. NPDC058110 TaxID=3346345 RepID=UPI0036DB206D